MREERIAQVRSASKMTLVGVVINGALALIKFLAGYIGHSQALIADAIESLGDVFSSLIVFFGIRFSTKPPDENHPYGHGKFEPMASVVVAIFLFAAALGIFIHSVDQLFVKDSPPHFFTLPVLIVVILVKWYLFHRVGKLSTQLSSLSLQGDALHHKSDALTSVAALVGISVSLLGGENFSSADDYAAIFAAIIICIGAYRILTPALHELTDRAPGTELVESVKIVARTVNGVIDLDKCFVRKMGLSFYVDLHIIVDGELNVREGHSIAHRVEEAIQRELLEITEVLVHVEPKR